MTCGVLYIVWGDAGDGLLDRSLASLRAAMSGLPIHIERLPEGATLLEKARMMGMSPFETTLYLDADTVVLGPLDFGFEMATKHGIACCVCECPWAARYGEFSHGDTEAQRNLVEYNTGVIFWEKAKAWEVFQHWEEAAFRIDSSITWGKGEARRRMPCNDQAGFVKAVADLEFNPFVLPLNWNFRPQWHRSWFGPIKIWHDRMGAPEEIASRTAQAEAMDFWELRVEAAGGQ